MSPVIYITFGFSAVFFTIGYMSEPTDPAFFAIAALCAAAASIAVAVGVIGDYFYNRRVDRNEAPYRLPFWHRWDGWRTGPAPEWMKNEYREKTIYDRRFKRKLAVVCLSTMPRSGPY